MRFDQKTILVIGGTTGIGRATVDAFVAEGAHVLFTGRDQKVVDRVASELGARCTGLAADIASPGDTTALMQTIEETFGRIDVLYVNAGVGAFMPIEQVTESDWDRITDTNIKGAYFCIQKALPLMGAGGSIVTCGSAAHVKALSGNSIYAATKAGLRAIVRNLALELMDRGIRVNSLSPGPVDTPIIDKAAGADSAGAAEIRRFMAEAVPMKRLGRPEEIARAVLFLASDEASFITGADLPVDGGMTNF
ncbi:MAG TPA: SDR family oxidoreductase [Sphingobium sp.]